MENMDRGSIKNMGKRSPFRHIANFQLSITNLDVNSGKQGRLGNFSIYEL